jgi:hypothetical protein
MGLNHLQLAAMHRMFALREGRIPWQPLTEARLPITSEEKEA